MVSLGEWASFLPPPGGKISTKYRVASSGCTPKEYVDLAPEAFKAWDAITDGLFLKGKTWEIKLALDLGGAPVTVPDISALPYALSLNNVQTSLLTTGNALLALIETLGVASAEKGRIGPAVPVSDSVMTAPTIALLALWDFMARSR